MLEREVDEVVQRFPPHRTLTQNSTSDPSYGCAKKYRTVGARRKREPTWFWLLHPDDERKIDLALKCSLVFAFVLIEVH